jgi:hypothetical protein
MLQSEAPASVREQLSCDKHYADHCHDHAYDQACNATHSVAEQEHDCDACDACDAARYQECPDITPDAPRVRLRRVLWGTRDGLIVS